MIRTTALILSIFLLVVLGGCARGPMIITKTDPATKHQGWEISAGPNKEIRISGILSGDGRGTTTRPEPQAGWFVAILSENELWYFDGDESLNLFYRTPEVTTTYNHDNAPMPVPVVVLDALPATHPIRKKPNKAMHRTLTRVTLRAWSLRSRHESRHG